MTRGRKRDIEIGIRAKDGTAEGLNSADSRFRKLSSTAKKSLRNIGEAAKIATAGITALGAATLYAANKSVKEVDELAKTIRKLRIDPKLFQSIKLQADDAGVSTDRVVKSFAKLEQSAGEAENGLATYSDAFERLGVNHKKADGTFKTGVEIFDDLAGAYENAGDKVAIMSDIQRIAGRGASELRTLFEQGSGALQDYAKDATSAGVAIDEGILKKSEEVNSKLSKLGAVISSKWNTAFVEIAHNFSGTLSVMTGLASAFAVNSSNFLATAFAPLFITLDELQAKFRDLTVGNEIHSLYSEIAENEKYIALLKDETSVIGLKGALRNSEVQEKIGEIQEKNILLQERLNELQSRYGQAAAETANRATAAIDQALITSNNFQSGAAFSTQSENVSDYDTGGLSAETEAHQAAADASIQIDKDSTKTRLGIARQFNSTIASINKSAAEENKRVSIAVATVAGIVAAVNAWRAGMETAGPWAPLVAVANLTASLATTGAQISAIKSGGTGGGAQAPATVSGNTNSVSSYINVIATQQELGQRIAESISGELADHQNFNINAA